MSEKLSFLKKLFDERPTLSLNEKLINRAEYQLKIIKPALDDFIERVISEQPDMIVFLDKGARLFGTPIKKYLSELELDKMPEIRFFNDNDLKGKYLFSMDHTNDFNELADDQLNFVKDKKVFFFDKTFSSGKGAAALKLAKQHLKNDQIYYFAMTRDPQHINESDSDLAKNFETYGISPEKHRENLKNIEDDEKFIIYNNLIDSLFSNDASCLYVNDFSLNGKTITFHIGTREREKMLEKSAKQQGNIQIRVPSAYEYTGEKKEEMKKKDYQTIGIIKNKIYKTLKGN